MQPSPSMTLKIKNAGYMLCPITVCSNLSFVNLQFAQKHCNLYIFNDKIESNNKKQRIQEGKNFL